MPLENHPAEGQEQKHAGAGGMDSVVDDDVADDEKEGHLEGEAAARAESGRYIYT